MASAEQPHLVSLVLQSKKALQHGEQLCSRSHVQYNASAQEAVDVLALDAKVRWISEAVIEQLKLAATVAKNIEEKRASLSKQVQSWDASRTKYTDALDSVLESLGRQLVPPDFHQSSADSSLFGSQHSEDEDDNPFKHAVINGKPTPPVSPSNTLRRNGSVLKDRDKGKGKAEMKDNGKKSKDDRSKWKTLRDFVDDRAIEDILEMIENDRNALEDTFNQTDDYSSSLKQTIASIQNALPTPQLVPILTRMQDILAAQDASVTSMAEKLESLAAHYDQMAVALKENEAGEAFSEEDLHNMNRDTEELPIIMGELEQSAKQIEEHHGQLLAAHASSQRDLGHLSRVLDDLDELGVIMGEMLETQDSVGLKCEEELVSLQRHLETLNHLHERYVLYQTAFNKLLLEIGRRRQYREAAENIVSGMIAQLEAMTQEENQVRKHFNAEYGAHLPEDICLCIANEPTRWEVLPWPGDTRESLPEMVPDLIADARERLSAADSALGTESL